MRRQSAKACVPDTSSLFSRSLEQLFWKGSILIAATHGRGMWQINREEGASAVEAAWRRLCTLEREVVKLGDVVVLPSPTQRSQLRLLEEACPKMTETATV